MKRKALTTCIILLVFLLILHIPFVEANTLNYSVELTLNPSIMEKNGSSIIFLENLPENIKVRYAYGYYAVPIIRLIILVPSGMNIGSVRVSLKNPAEIVLNKPLMRLPEPKPLSNINITYSSKPVNVEPGYDYFIMHWRGVKYVVVEIRPFKILGQYSLILYKNVVLNVDYTLKKQVSEKPVDWKIYGHVANVAINREEAVYKPTGGSSKPLILIITRPMFLEALEPYVYLRKHQGFNVSVVTVEKILNMNVEGRDIPEKIRNYVFQTYLATNGALKYLIIVGDVSGNTGYPNGPLNIDELEPWEVPTRYFYNPDRTGKYSHSGDYTPSDWYYATLDTSWDTDGNGIYGELSDVADWAPEIAVGRIAVRTVNELNKYLSSIMSYSRRSIDKLLLAGAILYYFNENNIGDVGNQGDTIMEIMWETFRGAGLLENVQAIRLYEHYPAISKITSPNDLNGNLSENNFVNAIYMLQPNIVVWAAHGWVNSVGRKLWVADNGDGVPSTYEIKTRKMIALNDLLDDYGYVTGLTVASSCLTAYYDMNDYAKTIFNVDNITSLGEAYILTTGLWYIGWNRITWIHVYFWDYRLFDPEQWGLSDGLTYRVLKNLLQNSEGDVGYSLVYAKTWLATVGNMGDQAFRKVWWASTLLGDPSQPLGKAVTKIVLHNRTGVVISPGEKLRFTAKLVDGKYSPLSNKPIQVKMNGEIIGEYITDSEGYVTFEYMFNNTGSYIIRFIYPGDNTTLPYLSELIGVSVVNFKSAVGGEIVAGENTVPSLTITFMLAVMLLMVSIGYVIRHRSFQT